MKKLTYIFGLLLITTGVFSQSEFTRYYHDGFYSFDDSVTIKLSDLFTTYKSEFGLTEKDEMIQKHYEIDSTGLFFASYQQYYKNFPVEGMLFTVTGQYDVVLSVRGFIMQNLDTRVTDSISESEALEIALDYIGAATYAWEVDSNEIILKEVREDSTATYFPIGKLIITKMHDSTYYYLPENFNLCYSFNIADDTFKTYKINVDAISGHIFDNYNNSFHDQSATGSVSTYYNQSKNITTTTCGTCFKFFSKDINRKIFVENIADDNDLISDGNNEWVENNTKRVAGTLLWIVKSSYDYYSTFFYRYDGYNTVVHLNKVNPSFPPPYYDPIDGERHIYFGLVETENHFAAFDIIAHEYSHSIPTQICHLAQMGEFEPSGLMESIADLFGELIEYRTMAHSDWIHGADDTQSDIRHIEDPTIDANPGFDWYPGFGNFGTNNHYLAGGIIRRWWYLLAFGGTTIHNGITYHVNGVGVPTAEKILYGTSNWILWPNADFQGFANQTYWWANEYWGHCSAVYKEVRNAWRAVGINLPNPCGVLPPGPKVWNSTRGNRVKLELTPEANSSTYESVIDDSVGVSNGSWVWHYPNSWTASTTHNSITFSDFGEHPVTSLISVDYFYAVDDSEYVVSDYKYIHFTDGNDQRKENIGIEKRKDEMTLFPNPSIGNLTIYLTKPIKNGVTEIYDLNGRLIYKGAFNGLFETVEIANSNAGNYILKVIASDFNKVQKFVIIK